MNIEKLQKTFNYSPETGIVTRKIAKGGAEVGSICGTVMKESGHLRIRFDGKKYLLHRLIWTMYNGSIIPNGIQVDHINHNPADNRIVNLRLVTSKENGRNKSKRKTSFSGVTGVTWKNNKWCARIKIDGKSIHLGYFLEFHKAMDARKNAEVLYGFHENHGK